MRVWQFLHIVLAFTTIYVTFGLSCSLRLVLKLSVVTQKTVYFEHFS